MVSHLTLKNLLRRYDEHEIKHNASVNDEVSQFSILWLKLSRNFVDSYNSAAAVLSVAVSSSECFPPVSSLQSAVSVGVDLGPIKTGH